MTTPEPRFRVEDKTPLDYPNCLVFFVEELVRGKWQLAIYNSMWIAFNDRAKADTVAAKLERGEDITEDMRRIPNRFWDREGYDPSAPLVQRS